MTIENCNCFGETLERVKSKLMERIPEDATQVNFEWEGYSFFMDGKPHVPVNPKVLVEYRGVKRNGEPKANLTKDSVSIMARYCPFCGFDTKKDEEG